MGSTDAGGRVDRALELIVVWVLAASSLGLAATLAGLFLAPQICIAATFLAGVYAWRVKGIRMPGQTAPQWKQIALLALVCLFFRLPAFNYVLGGQDEGLYVNMAHYIEQTGGVDVHDTPLEKLQGTEFVKRYLAENRQIRAYSGPLKGGDFVAGVYIHGPESSRLAFQFYHLFPVWMAIFAGVFGGTFAVYALTLFALLSVAFMYRLTLMLTDSSRVAFLAGLLLALNPLHAFFSKFPVTEVPALAFSAIGFTYLGMYWRADREARHRRWLLLSLLSFGALFVTRISGFMYVPFFFALAMASAITDSDRRRQRTMQFWTVGVVVLYALSVGYGLHWSHQYAKDIYRTSFDRVFPVHWRMWVAGIAVLGLAVWMGIAVAVKWPAGAALCQRTVSLARRAVGPIVIIGLAIGLHKIYQLGWTSQFEGDAGLSKVWGLAEGQWRAARASSLAALFVYLGPLLPVAFLALVLRRQDDPRVEFLRIFAAGFFVYLAVLQWVVPYGPYYSRYLLSEAVPYMLLLVVVVWARMPTGIGRRLLSAVMAVTLIYSGATTAAQLGKNESDGLYRALAQFLSPIDSSDVVLLDVLGPGLPNNSEIKTPIMFTFGLPAITVSSESLGDEAYIAALNGRYNDVFVISPTAVAPPGFASTSSSRIKIWAYEWNHSFPRKMFVREDMTLYLYRLVKPIFPLGHAEAFKTSGGWNHWLVSGWSSPEGYGVWSDGRHAEMDIDPQALPHVNHGIRLRMNISGLMTAAHPRQRIYVSVDGVNVASKTLTYPDAHGLLDVDIPAAELNSKRKIQVAFDLPDATTPKSLGINGDQRVLAIRLEAVTALALEEPKLLSLKPGPTGLMPAKAN